MRTFATLGGVIGAVGVVGGGITYLDTGMFTGWWFVSTVGFLVDAACMFTVDRFSL